MGPDDESSGGGHDPSRVNIISLGSAGLGIGRGSFLGRDHFSALGHHVLLIGGMATLVCTQRGWWVGASAAEQMVGSILAAVTYFVADRVLHGLEVRQWSWPFTLSISLVLASFVNGLASVALGWCLETGARPAHVRMVGRGR